MGLSYKILINIPFPEFHISETGFAKMLFSGLFMVLSTDLTLVFENLVDYIVAKIPRK